MSPSVVSVVLNWNSYQDSARCLRHLAELNYDNHEVVLVDNGSTDGSGTRLDEEFPNVTVIINETNLGFPGGMNVGIRQAIDRGSDYVWLLNNDVIVRREGVLRQLVNMMEAHPEYGAITPTVMNYPNEEDVWFIQGLVDWETGDSRHYREVVSDSKAEGDLLDNDFIPFCSALVRTEVFDDIGLLPEPYFLYREDIEFCDHIRRAGYSVGTETTIEVYHEETNASGGSMGQTITYYTARNRWLFKHRHSGRIGEETFLRSYIKWTTMQFGQLLLEREFRSIWALLRGTFDGILGVSGRGPYP